MTKKNKRKLIGAILGGLATYYLTKKTMSDENKYASIKWIDGEDDDSDEKPAYEFVRPKFRIGEDVIVKSPYTEEYVMYDDDIEPEYFTVNAHKFDADEGVFRYRMEDMPVIWYSEEWLLSPEISSLAKHNEDLGVISEEESEDDDDNDEDEDDGNKFFEAGKLTVKIDISDDFPVQPIEGIGIDDNPVDEELSRHLDEMTESKTVDMLLDKMNEGTEEEKQEALRTLREITDKGDI